MRTLLSAVLIVFCSSCLFSCKKDETTSSAPLSLVGKWELRKSIGGVGGLTYIYPPGSKYTVNFTATDFVFYDSGFVSHNGTYSIIKDTTKTDPAYFLFYMNNDKYNLYLEKDRFIFWMENPDTYYTTYERIQ